VIACECISHVLKPEDVCERKNKKKRAVERERFLTSQRTQISHHLEYFYNTTLIKKKKRKMYRYICL
jgi:hypothetical protein